MPARKHPPAFYQAVLACLITCRADKQTYKQTATALNAAGLLTPTSQVWSESHVRQTLKVLRNHTSYSSRIHAALMTFVFHGIFSVQQALSILQYNSKQ